MTQFLVGSGDTALLSRVASELTADPEVHIDRVLQTTTGVGGLVIETTSERAQRLRDEFGPTLVVEVDEQLGLS